MLFWIIAAIMSLLAILSLMPALLGKRDVMLETVRERNIAIAKERRAEIESAFESNEISADERDAAQSDLEASLAADLDEVSPNDQAAKPSLILAGAMAVIVPLLATVVYFATDHSGVPEMSQQTAPIAQSTKRKPPSLSELIAGLESKVAENPDDARGHFLLAETYKRLQRYGDAVKAYKKLRTLQPDNAETLSSYVDALVMHNDQLFTPETEELLDKAIELDPNHVNSLWLGGLAKQEFGKPQKALEYWLRLKPILADRPQDLAELQSLIDEVQGNSTTAAVSTAPLAIAAPTGTNSEAELPGSNISAGLSVEVSLNPAISSLANPSDLVFVFARAQTGPPMPLAAARKTVADLPFTIRLDDSMAMMPQMSLSQFPNVVVSARISKSGQPIAQAGDIQSELVNTANNNPRPIRLSISEIVQ